MALPLTNLTFHCDASVNTDLWHARNPFTNDVVDGEVVDFWDDVEHGANVFAGAGTPTWRSGTPLMALPCIEYNGTTDFHRLNDEISGTSKALSDVIANSAGTALIAVRVANINTNAANTYDNDCVFGDSGGYFGVHVKNAADPHALFYNYDGTDDAVSLPIALNTSHVLMWRHEGGNVYGSVDGGAESSAASGNTQVLTGIPQIGLASVSAATLQGRVGEFAVWNAALTGSNLSDAITYFTAKWLGVAPTGQPASRRWGGVPFMGGSYLRKGAGGGVWGRATDSKIIVPRRFAA